MRDLGKVKKLMGSEDNWNEYRADRFHGDDFLVSEIEEERHRKDLGDCIRGCLIGGAICLAWFVLSVAFSMAAL